MSNVIDIRNMQKIRPDLNDSQADEVIGFLQDVYDECPYKADDNRKLFEAAASLIYPEAKC